MIEEYKGRNEPVSEPLYHHREPSPRREAASVTLLAFAILGAVTVAGGFMWGVGCLLSYGF